MARKPLKKPPSQRHGYQPGGHRFRPLNFSAIELDVAYETSARAGGPEPVVFVVNLDDVIGGKLADQFSPADHIAEIKNEYRHSPDAPRFTFAVDRVKDALAILTWNYENAAQILETPIPPDHFRVIVVDRGGATCHPRPIPG